MAWKKLYESCVSETNPDKLKKLVFQLEDMIVLRYHDLVVEPKGSNGFLESDELQAIRRAAQQLLQLKIEKLGWPNPAAALAAGIPTSMPISMPAAMPPLIQTSMPPPALVDDLKEAAPLRTTRRTVASRWQSALLATRRAWQDWVFKSLK